MQKYIGTKLINATPMTLGQYNNLRGWLASQSDMDADDWVIIP